VTNKKLFILPFPFHLLSVNGIDFYVSHSFATDPPPVGSVIMIKYNRINEVLYLIYFSPSLFVTFRRENKRTFFSLSFLFNYILFNYILFNYILFNYILFNYILFNYIFARMDNHGTLQSYRGNLR
jgi:hypothetical protein